MNLSFPQMPEKLTSTEQDIVEYIAAHRDEFLCMTIGQMSAALHISEATVSRFARHVGCEDFKHLKRTVVEQTIQRGPAQKLNHTLQTGDGDLLTAWMEQQRYNLQKTLDLLDREAFASAVAALLGARKIFLHARNASRAPAVLLEYRLRRIGLEVEQLPAAGSELAERLAAIGPQDVVVLFAAGRGRAVRLCQGIAGGRGHSGPAAAGRLPDNPFHQPRLARRGPSRRHRAFCLPRGRKGTALDEFPHLGGRGPEPGPLGPDGRRRPCPPGRDPAAQSRL